MKTRFAVATGIFLGILALFTVKAIKTNESVTTEQELLDKKRILVASPIRQTPAILKEFLNSLRELNQTTFHLDYYFIDDNNDQASRDLLTQFCYEHGNNSIILRANQINDQQYVCNENSHYWKDNIIWKVAAFKDQMIQQAKNKNYDYLFLVDSDLVLHPETVDQLIKANKNIISNIFWTSWTPKSPKVPQVWLMDEYKLYQLKGDEKPSATEIQKRQQAFLAQLQKPGVYEVGGLGACTLINQKALKKGLSFKKIKNLSFWGEDRHFCIRAVSKGLSLFVDTHYPAYHIYRESELKGVEAYKKNFAKWYADSIPLPSQSFIEESKKAIASAKKSDDLAARFMVTSDACINQLANIELHANWWSRPYEYSWATKFASPEHTVLDAACGISHPFKWYLGETCKETWACDIDSRINSADQILEETRDDLGYNAFAKLSAKLELFKKVHLVQASICQLPEEMPKFDRIFCISTIEHLPSIQRKMALQEFSRKLAPNGLLVLTVDYPAVIPEDLIAMAGEAGLEPLGAFELGSPPLDAVSSMNLYIYRCVLKHKS